MTVTNKMNKQKAHFRRIGFVQFWDLSYQPKEAIRETCTALNRDLTECSISNDIPEHMDEVVDSSYKYTINLV